MNNNIRIPFENQSIRILHSIPKMSVVACLFEPGSA